MLRCANGHETPPRLKCEACGALVLYKQATTALLELPRVEPRFERVSVLSVGWAVPPMEGVAMSQITVAENESQSVAGFVLGRSEGGSWIDFYRNYLESVRRWMKSVALDRSRYSILVVDTTVPESVLAVAALPWSKNSLVLAITADKNSTLVEQSTSFVAVRTAIEHKLPVIAVSGSYADEAMSYSEEDGLAVRRQALSPIVSLLVSAIDEVVDDLGRDAKVGILEHCVSTILAGSDRVYADFGEALLAQEHNLSIDVEPGETTTVYLTAFAPAQAHPGLEAEFAEYRKDRLKGAVNAGVHLHLRRGRPDLFDMLLLYGLKEDRIGKPLVDAYRRVLEKAPDLELELTE